MIFKEGDILHFAHEDSNDGYWLVFDRYFNKNKNGNDCVVTMCIGTDRAQMPLESNYLWFFYGRHILTEMTREV